jgi:diguanylate cyclase (GGDEF)-like protein
MIDIDHFKAINDTYGHTIGDMVIRRVGEVCAGQLRDVDSIARLGGEEYAVLLAHASTEQAVEVAERIRRAVSAAALSADGFADFHVTCSIGVADCPETGDLADFLRVADRALYLAKSAGRNCVQVA